MKLKLIFFAFIWLFSIPVFAAENCSDSLDNDSDSLVDCNDPDCSSQCTACGANVLVNGSFEISSSSSSPWLFAIPSTSPDVIDGWTATDEGASGGCDILKYQWTDTSLAKDGTHVVDLQSNSNSGVCHGTHNVDQGIKQTATTEVGATYDLSYYFYTWDTEEIGGASSGLKVYVNGTLVQTLDTVPETASIQKYRFVATSTSTEIKFRNNDNKTTSVNLDDVRLVKVCATPPPAEICSDSVDNDGDGLADCLDSDCASVCSTCGSNLVTNGSFEISSSDPTGSVHVFPAINPTALDGWTVTNEGASGDCDVFKFQNALAVDGSFVLDLQSAANGGACSGTLNLDQGIKQSVATEVGETYELSFYSYSGASGRAAGSFNSLDVYINGVLSKKIAPIPKEAAEQTIRFVASSATTEIKFVNRANWRNLSGLDNVKLTKVCSSAVACTDLQPKQISMDANVGGLAHAVQNALNYALKKGTNASQSQFSKLSAEDDELYRSSWELIWTTLERTNYQTCTVASSSCTEKNNTATVNKILNKINRINNISKWAFSKKYASKASAARVAILKKAVSKFYKAAQSAVKKYPATVLSCAS